MRTKLTLSIDKNLAQFAHDEAGRQGQSISSMFSAFLEDKERQAARKAVPSVASMTGSLKGYSIDDSKKALRSLYAQKYSR